MVAAPAPSRKGRGRTSSWPLIPARRHPVASQCRSANSQAPPPIRHRCPRQVRVLRLIAARSLHATADPGSPSLPERALAQMLARDKVYRTRQCRRRHTSAPQRRFRFLRSALPQPVLKRGLANHGPKFALFRLTANRNADPRIFASATPCAMQQMTAPIGCLAAPAVRHVASPATAPLASTASPRSSRNPPARPHAWRAGATVAAATINASIKPHIGSSQANPTRGATSGWRLSPANPA